MIHHEDRLHESVADYLRIALPSDYVWNSVENRGVGVKEGKRRKKRGCQAGYPDIVIHCPNNQPEIFIELKSPTGRLSAAQKEYHEALESIGKTVYVCRSVKDVEASLLYVGIKLKARVVGNDAGFQIKAPNQ